MSTTSGAVKPPIQLFGLEGRYATALYSAATKLKQLEKVENELNQVQEAIKKNRQLREVITSPIINRKLLENTLKDFGAKASLSSASINLLVLLAENRRLKKVDGIINAFKTIMAAHRGEIVCEVTTAKPLEGSQRKQLEDALRVSQFLNYQNRAKLTHFSFQFENISEIRKTK